MTNLPLALAFLQGVCLAELAQWGVWKKANADKAWLSYWKGLGPTHLFINGGADIILYNLWTMAWLNEAVNLLLRAIPRMPPVYFLQGDIPLMPQVGLMLGFGIDFCADGIAFVLRGAVTSIAQGIVNRVLAVLPGKKDGGTDAG